jgi:hypothetical protein
MDLFAERVICDYLFEKDKIYAYQTLSDEELIVYDRIFSILSERIAKLNAMGGSLEKHQLAGSDFMLGLPTETEADLQGICDLAEDLLALGKTYSRRVRITVNLSTFIPKPHTPFQWERQISIEETFEKQKYIKQHLRTKGIEIRWQQRRRACLFWPLQLGAHETRAHDQWAALPGADPG